MEPITFADHICYCCHHHIITMSCHETRATSLPQTTELCKINKTSQRNAMTQDLSVLWWYERGGEKVVLTLDLFRLLKRAQVNWSCFIALCELPIAHLFECGLFLGHLSAIALLLGHVSHCTHIRHSGKCSCRFNESGCQAGVHEERPKPPGLFLLDTSPNESQPAIGLRCWESRQEGKRGMKMLTFRFPNWTTR